MTCDERDPDLLLLAHGELSPLRRLLTQAHLRRCARCRNRQASLSAASYALADAIRAPDQPRWSPATNPPSTRPLMPLSGGLLWASVVLLLTLLACIAIGVVVHYTYSRGSASSAAQSVPCRPDLPSDRCR